MELGSYFLFLQEQIKDIIIIGASQRSPSQCQCVCLFGLWSMVFRGCMGIRKALKDVSQMLYVRVRDHR